MPEILSNDPVDVFFDLDGSLIDTKYATNADPSEFREALYSLGSIVKAHLNSNRSAEGLRAFYNLFGFNGYTVIENGCCYLDPSTGKQSDSIVERFDRTKLKCCSEFPVHFVSVDEIENGTVVPPSTGTFVFAEPTRQYTATLYPRHIDGGLKPVWDTTLLDRVCGRVRDAFPGYDVTSDPAKYCNVLIKPKGVLKSTLMGSLSMSSRIASFGDSSDDICMFECSAFCGAPANASVEVKNAVVALGGVVSTKPHTQGAIEFLQAARNYFSRH